MSSQGLLKLSVNCKLTPVTNTPATDYKVQPLHNPAQQTTSKLESLIKVPNYGLYPITDPEYTLSNNLPLQTKLTNVHRVYPLAQQYSTPTQGLPVGDSHPVHNSGIDPT